MDPFPYHIFQSPGKTSVLTGMSCKEGARQEGAPSAFIRFTITTVLTDSDVDHVPLSGAARASRDFVVDTLDQEEKGGPIESTVMVKGPFPPMQCLFDHPEDKLKVAFSILVHRLCNAGKVSTHTVQQTRQHDERQAGGRKRWEQENREDRVQSMFVLPLMHVHPWHLVLSHVDKPSHEHVGKEEGQGTSALCTFQELGSTANNSSSLGCVHCTTALQCTWLHPAR